MLDLGVVFLGLIATLFVFVSIYGAVKLGGNPRLVEEFTQQRGMRIFSRLAHGILYISYFSLAHWYSGQTVGKWILGLKLRDELGLGKSFLRTMGYFASAQLTLGVGFLFAYFREDGRALHDIIANTDVCSIHQTAREEAALEKAA